MFCRSRYIYLCTCRYILIAVYFTTSFSLPTLAAHCPLLRSTSREQPSKFAALSGLQAPGSSNCRTGLYTPFMHIPQFLSLSLFYYYYYFYSPNKSSHLFDAPTYSFSFFFGLIVQLVISMYYTHPSSQQPTRPTRTRIVTTI